MFGQQVMDGQQSAIQSCKYLVTVIALDAPVHPGSDQSHQVEQPHTIVTSGQHHTRHTMTLVMVLLDQC